MSQPIRQSSAISPPWRAVVLHGYLLVAMLVASPGLAQSAGSLDNAASQVAQPQDTDKKKKKSKPPKLSKEQKRRLDVESGGRTAVEWYQQAIDVYRSGHYLDARAVLLPLEDSARAIDIQEQVKLLIADTYFAQGGTLNLAEALARYKSFATFFPSSQHAEYVQFQIGRSYFKQLGPSDRDQSYTDSVVAEYGKFLEIYPKSQYAEQAEREMTEAIVLRARHEFAVGRFYWGWKDYRACATRLKTVLRDFPELPEREEALWMCAQSLYNSGKRAEGDSYAARLAADYPASTYTARLDAGAAGGKMIQAQVKRQAKSDKEADRTHRRQMSQDRKRTRQIRKDSGLPAEVPGLMDASAPPTESSTPASTAPAASGEPAAAPSADQAAREAALVAQEKARREQAEKEEQAQEAKKAEQEKTRAQKQQQEADKAAAREAARLAKVTPEQAEKQAKEQAEKAARDKAEAEKLEAEEAAKAAKEAEAQKKREEKAAAEAAKKAEKKAKKGAK